MNTRVALFLLFTAAWFEVVGQTPAKIHEILNALRQEESRGSIPIEESP